jgi:medium-chain acyl-[acyl-carrier-protein] hydrolase
MVTDWGEPPWLVAPSRGCGELKLVICPSAGSGVAPYVPWARSLADLADVRILLLPGRESRLKEPLLDRIEAIVPPLTQAVTANDDGRPLLLYGHSMGALVAFELARELEGRGRALWGLVVSGRRAPHLPERMSLHTLPEEALLRELRRFGGTPEAVLQERALVETLLPAVRADMAVTETYVYPGGSLLSAPIAAFGGTLDPAADLAEIEGWRERTSGGFSHQILPGGHFFIQGAAFRNAFRELLAQAARGARPSLEGRNV